MSLPHAPAPAAGQEDVLYVHAWVFPEGEGWTALIEEYDIAGVGHQREAAVKQARELLEDYLMISARDGLSPEEARRPIPLGTKARLAARVVGLRLLARMSRRPRPARLDEAIVPHHC